MEKSVNRGSHPPKPEVLPLCYRFLFSVSSDSPSFLTPFLCMTPAQFLALPEALKVRSQFYVEPGSSKSWGSEAGVFTKGGGQRLSDLLKLVENGLILPV